MFHIGVDIGGTFTDCVLIGDSTKGIVTYSTAKALSTKADPAEGVLAGLTELGANVGLARPELLARTGRFGHGTTIGTNAVLERTGARVGAAMLLREYLCPLTGLRLTTELIRAGDDPAPDMVLAG